jgi:hypothetical protein
LRTGFITYAIVLTLIFPLCWPQIIGLAHTEQLHYTQVNSDQIWNIHYGSVDSTDAAYSIIATNDGGCVIAGSIYTNGELDVLLIRITETGIISWVQSLGGEGNQVALEVIACESGGYAVIGYESLSTSNTDALLIRCDALGHMIWAERYGGVSFDEGIALVECASGGFAFAGYFTNLDEYSSDFWLVHTNSEGQQVWNQTFPRYSADICYSLVETENGGFVLAGSTESYGQGDENGWLVATDSLGNMLWNYTYRTNQFETIHDIIRNRNGGYMVAGTAERVYVSVAVLEFDYFGTLISEYILPISFEDYGYSITKCSDGGYAITGYTSVDEDTQIVTNLLVLRIDETGDIQWSKNYGGFLPDMGYSIVQATNGDLIVAGITQSYATTQSDAWMLRVPDLEASDGPNYVPGPLDISLISLGVFLALIVLAVSYLVYHQSRGELKGVWIETSKSDLLKSSLSPRVLEELDSVLRGPQRCRNCGTVHYNAELVCSKCGLGLHRCMFCDEVLGDEELIVFCQNCKSLAHYHHMQKWLEKHNFCPNCGVQLQQSSTRF